jgi:hypothetical protein
LVHADIFLVRVSADEFIDTVFCLTVTKPLPSKVTRYR